MCSSLCVCACGMSQWESSKREQTSHCSLLTSVSCAQVFHHLICRWSFNLWPLTLALCQSSWLSITCGSLKMLFKHSKSHWSHVWNTSNVFLQRCQMIGRWTSSMFHFKNRLIMASTTCTQTNSKERQSLIVDFCWVRPKKNKWIFTTNISQIQMLI